MAAYYKVEVSLGTNALTVGVLEAQTVNVVLPTVGPQGEVGAAGPTGPTGSTGPANSLAIGTVTTGAEGSGAAATITGTAPSQTLSLAIPVGATGATGPANSLDIGTVSTGAPGSNAAATVTGAAPAQTLNLTIPRGDVGATGATGAVGPTGPAGTATTDASELTTGTLDDARLSGNVPLEDAANTFTQNQTLDGTNNVAPNQTAASGSSLMTRDLVDARASLVFWFQQIGSATAVNNGAGRYLGPARQHNFSSGMGIAVPSDYKKFRIVWWGAWTTAPTAASFPTFTRFGNPGALSNISVETDHGVQFGQTAYPNTATGLAGTLTLVGTFTIGTLHHVYRYVSETITIPAGWQTNAATNNGYECLGFFIANDSGGTLTDGYNVNHGFRGYMEFLK